MFFKVMGALKLKNMIIKIPQLAFSAAVFYQQVDTAVYVIGQVPQNGVGNSIFAFQHGF